jgi:hypothetical protein
VELYQVADNNLTVKSILLQKVKQDFDLAISFATANSKKDEIRKEYGTQGGQKETETRKHSVGGRPQ